MKADVQDLTHAMRHCDSGSKALAAGKEACAEALQRLPVDLARRWALEKHCALQPYSGCRWIQRVNMSSARTCCV